MQHGGVLKVTDIQCVMEFVYQFTTLPISLFRIREKEEEKIYIYIYIIIYIYKYISIYLYIAIYLLSLLFHLPKLKSEIGKLVN